MCRLDQNRRTDQTGFLFEHQKQDFTDSTGDFSHSGDVPQSRLPDSIGHVQHVAGLHSWFPVDPVLVES